MQNKYPNQKTKRFNTPAYKKRMDDARHYKRRQSSVPTEESLARRKWLKIIPVVLVLGLLVYAVYFAAFMRVRAIIVNGADGTLQADIQNNFSSFLSGYNYGLPEKNILFFSKSKFTKIISADGLVAKVQSVQKKYWHTIVVSVVQRVPAYLLQTPSNTYVVANDGVVSAELSLTDPVPQGLPIISDAATDNFQIGSSALSFTEINFITAIKNKAQSYEISSKGSEFLTVLASAGYKIYFDYTDDPATDLEHLQNTLAQQGPGAHIAYIDLRFNPRVYVCLIGQSCAMPAAAPATTPQP